MNVVRKVDSVVMHKCDDGLQLTFSNKAETATITIDWVELAKMMLQMNEHGDEAYTMMQIGLDPYRESHRHSFTLSYFQAAG